MENHLSLYVKTHGIWTQRIGWQRSVLLPGNLMFPLSKSCLNYGKNGLQSVQGPGSKASGPNVTWHAGGGNTEGFTPEINNQY
jgi:hypothetical protein